MANAEDLLKQRLMSKAARTVSPRKTAKRKAAKKALKKSPASVAASPVPDTKKAEFALYGDVSVYGGKNIRRFYSGGHWFFPVTDLAVYAGITDYGKFIESVPESDRKNIDDITVSLPVLNENHLEEKIDCISWDNFMRFLRLVYKFGKVFPGAFPRWLEGVSKLPFTYPKNIN